MMTSDPVCCEPSDAVPRVAQVMKQQDVGSVPVVESQSSRRLVGMVTDRDLVTKIVAEGRDVARATVREAMTANPISCREDDDVKDAMAAMSERQVRRMPVVDGEGRVTGIIAQADVATRMGQDRDTGQMVESISEPSHSRR
jgi:CBS domain-containing protein